MLEKIFGLIFAIAGLCAGLVFMGLGVFLIKTHSSVITWIAMVAIFGFSLLAVFISVCPLISSFEKSNTELEKVKTPDEPEKEKLGFFAPFELV